MANKNVLTDDSYWTFQDSHIATLQGLTEYFEYTIASEGDTPANKVNAGPNGLSPIDEYEVSWFFDDYQMGDHDN